MIQLASDSGNAAALVFFPFDLLYVDGEDLCPRPLANRKARLADLLSDAHSPLHYCDHQVGHGRAFHEKACATALEGIVSKAAVALFRPMPDCACHRRCCSGSGRFVREPATGKTRPKPSFEH